MFHPGGSEPECVLRRLRLRWLQWPRMRRRLRLRRRWLLLPLLLLRLHLRLLQWQHLRLPRRRCELRTLPSLRQPFLVTVAGVALDISPHLFSFVCHLLHLTLVEVALRDRLLLRRAPLEPGELLRVAGKREEWEEWGGDGVVAGMKKWW